MLVEWMNMCVLAQSARQNRKALLPYGRIYPQYLTWLSLPIQMLLWCIFSVMGQAHSTGRKAISIYSVLSCSSMGFSQAPGTFWRQATARVLQMALEAFLKGPQTGWSATEKTSLMLSSYSVHCWMFRCQ